jgi:hypothetical protein
MRMCSMIWLKGLGWSEWALVSVALIAIVIFIWWLFSG